MKNGWSLVLSRSLSLIVLGATLSYLVACGGGGGSQQMGRSLQGLQISPTNPQAVIGQSLQLTATASYSDGTTQDVTGQAAWSSSNTAVATAQAGGLVDAVAAGVSSIGASLSGVNASTSVTVTGSSGGPTPGYAYITSAATGNQQVAGAVYQYSIAADGTLSALGEASVATGVNPRAIVSTPDGRNVYVANLGDGTIWQYSVGSTGQLTAGSQTAVALQTSTTATTYLASIDPTGRFLYVVADELASAPLAYIAQYSIGSDGTLQPLTPATVTLEFASPQSIVIDSSGQHAYLAGTMPIDGVSSSAGAVAQFTIGSDGTLAPMQPPTVPGTLNVTGMTIAPGGAAAYVLSSCVDTSCDGQIAQYTVGATGQLTQTAATTLTGTHVDPLQLIISGSSAYLLTSLMGVDTDTGAVYQYALGSTGILTADTPASLSGSLGPVSASAYGANLYVLNATADGMFPSPLPGGQINHYVINSNGLLSAAASTPLQAGVPTAMTLVAAP